MDFIDQVKEFHRVFNHKISDNIDISDTDLNDLRIELLSEELEELSDALKEDDKVEVADALADIMYVLSGAILSLGYESKFEELFNEVHSSNMSKLCEDKSTAEETIEFYGQRQIETYTKQLKCGRYAVYRSSDNKILKSVKYKPANLESILNENRN